MDNFILNCNAKQKEDLLRLIEVAFSVQAPRGASHFKEVRLKSKTEYGRIKHFEHPDGTPTFILMWHEGHKNKGIPLPVRMNAAVATETVWSWLEQTKSEDRAERLDHDGSNGKGFKVFCDFWGHIGDNRYAICGIQPIWAWYGK